MRVLRRTAALAATALMMSCGDGATGPGTKAIEPSILFVEPWHGWAVRVSWTMCENEAFDSYTLYRSMEGGIPDDSSSAVIAGVFMVPSSTAFIDPPVVGATNHYAVLTLDDQGNGVWSNEDSIFVPSVQTVEGFSLDSSSAGREVVLTWNSVAEADSYRVYFRTGLSGLWYDIGDPADTTFTHTADIAGYYSVKASQDEFLSGSYAEAVSTMPLSDSVTYTIWDDQSPSYLPDAFIFGPHSGETGNAPDPGFIQDIYAHDPVRGDRYLHIYSGAMPPFGSGNVTFMAAPLAETYCLEYPEGEWYTDYPLTVNEGRVFLYLSDGSYVKMFDLVLLPDTSSTLGTSLDFRYEIQTEGLTLFTDN
ncbi:MAG: hypothetical protein R6U39_10435 [Candidatus Aegiribacteria sp.]